MNGFKHIIHGNPPHWARMLAMAVFALFASLAMAQSGAKFSMSKEACLGNLTSLTDPSNCTPADTVASGTTGYYMITLTNPWGQAQQTINLTDSVPPQFTPTVGAIFCRDSNNLAVGWTPSNSSYLATVTLGVGQTVHCYIGGTFNGGGSAVTATNVATGNNSVSPPINDEAKTTVLPSSQLGVNLALTKTASAASVDLTTGAQTITYTITITNQGTVPVTLGQWFELHDSFALLPNSVPINASISNVQCSATAGSDCLDSGGPQFNSQWDGFLGTMNGHPAFDWGFANNSDSIAAGGVLTITFDVEFSAAKGVDCVKDKAANGVKNTAFFTLTSKSSGSAKTDLNAADNTASVNVAASMPFSTQDEDCATGQLKVTKKQLSPAGIAGWGPPVDYEIRIENVSVPAKTITIDKNNLQDSVQEGINTPPFDRKHVNTYCDAAASSPHVCDDFTSASNGGINVDPGHRYTYYLEMNQGWDNSEKVKLDPGEYVVFRTSFVYLYPDCETVPNTASRPIFNHVRVTYKAQPYGSPSGTPAVMMSQSAKAETQMKKQPACKFKVTKSTTNTTGKLQFGAPIKYTVTFTNLGPGRKIGTVMDAVRISIPNYASMLPFTANWTCVGVATINGNLNSGYATYVPSPAQGAPAALLNLGSNIYFPSGGSLTCTITMTVQRPPLNDTFCTRDDAYFENLALMDVTAPFNSNIAWPPSGIYLNPPILSNPNPQNRNWASVRLMLPKCWDAHIQKSARVDNLPAGTKPWTYFGNTADVHFDITVTNDADSPLGTNAPPGNGWIAQDKFASGGVYGSGQLNPAVPADCNPPANWAHCTSGGQIGVRNLLPHVQGKWTSTLDDTKVQNGKDIRNCSWLYPQYAMAGPDWYNRQLPSIPSYGCWPIGSSQPSAACEGTNQGPLVSCAYVPVLQVTKITVNKVIVDQTNSGVTSSPGYVVNVGCTPYAIPTTIASSFTLTAGGAAGVVSVVPMGGTCTVTETVKPVPAAISTKCGGVANVAQSTSITPLPATLNPVNNVVTVTNTYACVGGPTLVVAKKFLNPEVPNGGGAFPPMGFPVSVNCVPGGIQTQTIPTTGNAWSSVSFPVTVGAVCQVVENTANIAFPQAAINFCAQMTPSQIPVWKPPVYNPQNGTSPGTSITIGTGTNQVQIKNEWKCQLPPPPPAQLELIKELSVGFAPMPVPAITWNFAVNCNPQASTLSAPITTGTSSNTLITASYPQIITAPVNANCTVTEQSTASIPIPPIYQDWCSKPAQGSGIAVWNAPEYSVNNGPYSTTPPNLQLPGGITVVRVRNGWHCVPSTTPTTSFQYQVFKRVTGPTQQVPAMTFQINTNCSQPSTPQSLSITTPIGGLTTGGGAFSIPAGSTCNLSEAMPDPKQIPAMVAYCSAQAPNIEPKWLAPIWSTSATGSPALALPITASASQNLFVINTWTCGPPAAAKVKPKSKPKIKVNIGIGSIFGGGGDKPKDKPRDDAQNPPRP